MFYRRFDCSLWNNRLYKKLWSNYLDQYYYVFWEIGTFTRRQQLFRHFWDVNDGTWRLLHLKGHFLSRVTHCSMVRDGGGFRKIFFLLGNYCMKQILEKKNNYTSVFWLSERRNFRRKGTFASKREHCWVI